MTVDHRQAVMAMQSSSLHCLHVYCSFALSSFLNIIVPYFLSHPESSPFLLFSCPFTFLLSFLFHFNYSSFSLSLYFLLLSPSTLIYFYFPILFSISSHPFHFPFNFLFLCHPLFCLISCPFSFFPFLLYFHSYSLFLSLSPSLFSIFPSCTFSFPLPLLSFTFISPYSFISISTSFITPSLFLFHLPFLVPFSVSPFLQFYFSLSLSFPFHFIFPSHPLPLFYLLSFSIFPFPFLF